VRPALDAVQGPEARELIAVSQPSKGGIARAAAHERRILMNAMGGLSDYDHAAVRTRAEELTADRITRRERLVPRPADPDGLQGRKIRRR
jgi:hypothetical protein